MQVKANELPLHAYYKIKKANDNKHWQRCGKIGTPLHCWLDCKMMQLLLETVWSFLKMLNIKLWYDLLIPLLGLCPRELKALCTSLYSIGIHNVQNVETIQVSTKQYIDKVQHIHTREYYSVIQRSEAPIRATTRLDLDSAKQKKPNILKISLKITCCVIPFMWKVQKRQIPKDRK